ncbi:uncharacterized protein PgNI_12553 [Pyricularia grisea]|uniref:Uncharacterized protein n=1 Tax=Pyricularia grisea TaxID=148305 RepID=A0A6P8AM41_PYRGI|nr:uncharacterized protein PgNI_12553 [Pyricularia grisea]TLD03098.1 hypothetical protein PgNI_12553 [Pyricularia grisea]
MEHGFSCPQGGHFYAVVPLIPVTEAEYARKQTSPKQASLRIYSKIYRFKTVRIRKASINPYLFGACAASDFIPARLSDNRTRASVFLSAITNITLLAIALPSNLPVVSVESIPAYSIQPAVIAAIIVSAIALIELSNFPLITTIPETSGHIRTNEANLISNNAQLVGSYTDQV